MSNESFRYEEAEPPASPPPLLPDTLPEDERYLLLLTRPLEVCLNYLPRFGQGGSGVSLTEFRQLYGEDPFYHWMGLDSPLMYAAHKAAGGMTSVYRQLGIGAQWLFNQIVQDHLGLTREEANWSYQVPSTKAGILRTLALDARIEPDHIRAERARERVRAWQSEAIQFLALPETMSNHIRGTVFEARQGYKSKDSKRQNADISNAANAYVHAYMPVLLLFSNQIDGDLAERYTAARWLLLRGTQQGTYLDSTYVFCREIVGYDLAGFFARNSARIRARMEQTLEALLRA